MLIARVRSEGTSITTMKRLNERCASSVLDTAPQTGIGADDALWYKDAVIYQVNVKSFFDSNDDGIGDFKGLTSKLEYIRDLGVNTIWLMPFYPSPLKDDGYDIADYQNVHPQFGTLDDFRAMLREAHRLELKVVTELIINHTSDQHPWFPAARSHRGFGAARFLCLERHGSKIPRRASSFTDTETRTDLGSRSEGYYWHDSSATSRILILTIHR